MKKYLFILLLLLGTWSAKADDSQTVILNAHSNIYHTTTCARAKNCTRNCIEVPKENALERQARSCKICEENH